MTSHCEAPASSSLHHRAAYILQPVMSIATVFAFIQYNQNNLGEIIILGYFKQRVKANIISVKNFEISLDIGRDHVTQISSTISLYFNCYLINVSTDVN